MYVNMSKQKVYRYIRYTNGIIATWRNTEMRESQIGRMPKTWPDDARQNGNARTKLGCSDKIGLLGQNCLGGFLGEPWTKLGESNINEDRQIGIW